MSNGPSSATTSCCHGKLTLPEGSISPSYLSFRTPGETVESRRKSWLSLVAVDSHLCGDFFQGCYKPLSGDLPGWRLSLTSPELGHTQPNVLAIAWTPPISPRMQSRASCGQVACCCLILSVWISSFPRGVNTGTAGGASHHRDSDLFSQQSSN